MTLPTLNPPLPTDTTTEFNSKAFNWAADLLAWSTAVNALAAGLDAIAAGGAMAIPYSFSTTTTDSDPGAGMLRLDNATQNAATTIRVDLAGADAATWTSVLDTFDDSTSAIKGFIRLIKVADVSKFLIFSVSALTSPSGYKNITVANVASSSASPFANNDSLILEFTRNGDKGELGSGMVATVNTTLTASATLSGASGQYVPVAMTAVGQSITEVDATTLTVGGPRRVVKNKGGYPVGYRDSAGVLLGVIAPGGILSAILENNSTAAGVWSVTGDNLEPGLMTIDNLFSATYSGTLHRQYVALDGDKSLHFVALASGFAVFAVDNATKAVGTPVTISATAGMAPRAAFKITSTTAIVFYNSNAATLIAVVVSLSGATSLAVGTPSSTLSATGCGLEDVISAPKIVQLDTTLYLVSYATATGAGTTSVAAFQVLGGTAANLGSTVNIIAANNVHDSTHTYSLTTTTGLVIYASGASPYALNAVVVSVTNANPPVCTVGTPAACAGSVTAVIGDIPISCCQLIAGSKFIAAIGDTGNNRQTAVAITISAGTTVTWGTPMNIEATLIAGALKYTGDGFNRYKSHLWRLTDTKAGLAYKSAAGDSRAVVLTESSGVITAGSITYKSISAGVNEATFGGMTLPQGTDDFVSVFARVASGNGWFNVLAPTKISGTAMIGGAAYPINIPGSPDSLVGIRFSSGKQAIMNASYMLGEMPIFSSNGDYIKYHGDIKIPLMQMAGDLSSEVANNRAVFLGYSYMSQGGSSPQLRVINVELAL